jgi:hypothetical protein
MIFPQRNPAWKASEEFFQEAEVMRVPYFWILTERPPAPEEIAIAAPAAIPMPITIKVAIIHSYSGFFQQGSSSESAWAV